MTGVPPAKAEMLFESPLWLRDIGRSIRRAQRGGTPTSRCESDWRCAGFRTFSINRQVKLQFRAEAFNVSNTPHFANPNGNVNRSNFGKVLATQSAYAVGRSREFRLGLRLAF